MTNSDPKRSKIRDLGDGLYNLRAPFYVAGIVNVGTAMSFVKLNNGKFIVLSTVTLDKESKAEVDTLTQNGELIEAVLATNPFHTLAFPAFHAAYPKAPIFGTPRHIRNYPDIPWAGAVTSADVLTKWTPELELSIPAGCEFDSPQPEIYNHFCGVISFHRASRFLIGDDTFEAVKGMNAMTSFATGLKNGDVRFHPAFPSENVFLKTPEAPKQCYEWFQTILRDWDFDNLVSAHNGVMIGGFKEKLRAAVERAKPGIQSIAKARGGSML
ncbi:UNVERIFIED_CONTAM: hypothetical protein HDU68_011433 [Siphonaria sp. JEL0065]|nr:hypothetical protein HDU68_011433 [Siphonaria sp. JEL0065]